VSERPSVEKLGWVDIGISDSHGPYVTHDHYVPGDVYERSDMEAPGLHPVLEQRLNAAEPTEWHLHQDLVLGLRLKREGDVWVCPNEDYVEVARLHRDETGSPVLLEFRAEYLRDYLCARDMGLYITSYRQRIEIEEDISHLGWTEPAVVENLGMRWEGRTMPIHEGGHPFGEQWHVLHLSRTDVDPDEDIPRFDIDESVESKSWTTAPRKSRKLFRVEGELWKNEWIDPGPNSPRLRGDKLPPTVFFIVDAKGTKENRETLAGGCRWLWFRPEVVMTLAHRRGGSLKWYTRDTGSVGCSPDYGVHFGMNKLGMVNIFAKDIALVPEWQQRIWSGDNISPEGGVSEELLASQMKAMPAGTQAPEAFLPKGIDLLNEITQRRFKFRLFREHDQYNVLLAHAHRFRATSRDGLFSLAKDLARLTADSINISALQGIVAPPKGEKWGSLRSLEAVLAKDSDPSTARSLLTPLVGIYELRHADAHLPSKDVEEALKMVGVDERLPFVLQGYSLLDSCVSSLFSIAKSLEESRLPV